jgi:hypothetical protein
VGNEQLSNTKKTRKVNECQMSFKKKENNKSQHNQKGNQVNFIE